MKNRRLAATILTISVLTVAVYLWVQYNERHPSTSDAYIVANVIQLSPQISGQVSKVAVQSYQSVKKGDVLLQIDQRNYQLAVERAQANLALVQAQTLSAREQTKANLAKASASQQQQENMALNNQRTKTLAAKGAVAKEQADDNAFKLKEATANTLAANALIAFSQAQVSEAESRLEVAKIALAQAKLNFSYTVITAPVDGIIGKVKVQAGDFINTGEPLFPMVDDSLYWLAANFKETDLERIKPGQTATINLDMYPQQSYRGQVESLSPASGLAFSLIPPQNATGNWVKVTQRFPVRIKINNRSGNADKTPPLRLGASATVSINTTVPVATNTAPSANAGETTQQ